MEDKQLLPRLIQIYHEMLGRVFPLIHHKCPTSSPWKCFLTLERDRIQPTYWCVSHKIMFPNSKQIQNCQTGVVAHNTSSAIACRVETPSPKILENIKFPFSERLSSNLTVTYISRYQSLYFDTFANTSASLLAFQIQPLSKHNISIGFNDFPVPEPRSDTIILWQHFISEVLLWS